MFWLQNSSSSSSSSTEIHTDVHNELSVLWARDPFAGDWNFQYWPFMQPQLQNNLWQTQEAILQIKQLEGERYHFATIVKRR